MPGVETSRLYPAPKERSPEASFSSNACDKAVEYSPTASISGSDSESTITVTVDLGPASTLLMRRGNRPQGVPVSVAISSKIFSDGSAMP